MCTIQTTHWEDKHKRHVALRHHTYNQTKKKKKKCIEDNIYKHCIIICNNIKAHTINAWTSEYGIVYCCFSSTSLQPHLHRHPAELQRHGTLTCALIQYWLWIKLIHSKSIWVPVSSLIQCGFCRCAACVHRSRRFAFIISACPARNARIL